MKGYWKWKSKSGAIHAYHPKTAYNPRYRSRVACGRSKATMTYHSESAGIGKLCKQCQAVWRKEEQ